MPTRKTHPINIAGLQRELPLFKIKPGLTIAILNILGDTELVHACAIALAKKLENMDFDIIVTAEAKSIPIAYALSVEMKKPYIVLRKTYKPYMGQALKTGTLSITTGKNQNLFLDEKDLHQVENSRVLILDDVISTGSTLQGMRKIMKKAGAKVVVEAAILTEGEQTQWGQVVALGHLPIFTD